MEFIYFSCAKVTHGRGKISQSYKNILEKCLFHLCIFSPYSTPAFQNSRITLDLDVSDFKADSKEH